MKEFEKWLDGQIPESHNTKEIYIEERGMRKGWKAALEMVQDWYQDVREGREKYQEFDLGLWGMLRKELNGKT